MKDQRLFAQQRFEIYERTGRRCYLAHETGTDTRLHLVPASQRFWLRGGDFYSLLCRGVDLRTTIYPSWLTTAMSELWLVQPNPVRFSVLFHSQWDLLDQGDGVDFYRNEHGWCVDGLTIAVPRFDEDVDVADFLQAARSAYLLGLRP